MPEQSRLSLAPLLSICERFFDSTNLYTISFTLHAKQWKYTAHAYGIGYPLACARAASCCACSPTPSFHTPSPSPAGISYALVAAVPKALQALRRSCCCSGGGCCGVAIAGGIWVGGGQRSWRKEEEICF
eukprot:1142017-Pelagomonas_calceolata.AAC.3